MRIAYFINQYPAVSHTFIRREIRAMEALGVTVFRFALYKGDNLVDDEDKAEASKTRLILSAGIGEIVRCCTIMLSTRTLALASVVREALNMGRRSDRGILRHIAYAIEACVLATWCREAAVQHIHAHFGTNPAAIAMLASRLSNIPYSFTAHGSEEFLKAPLLSLDTKLKYAKLAICVSSFGKSQLMRWSSSDRWNKIEVVHCGLDQAYFDRAIKPVSSSSKIVCVGRLDENKAQILLVRAASLLREQGVNCEIVLVGDGPMRKSIEEAIATADMQNTIKILGWASGDRVASEIEAARALVLPSLSENMPVVIMEALALGRPVISTYIAGIPELVQDGKTGWLVPASDDVALANAMREAILVSVEQLAAMGEMGRRHVLKNHDAFMEAKKLKGLLERTIES